MDALRQVGDELLIIKTRFAKELKLEPEEVSGIRTDSPVTVIMNSGGYYTGQLLAADEGHLRLAINGVPVAKEMPLTVAEASTTVTRWTR